MEKIVLAIAFTGVIVAWVVILARMARHRGDD